MFKKQSSRKNIFYIPPAPLPESKPEPIEEPKVAEPEPKSPGIDDIIKLVRSRIIPKKSSGARSEARQHEVSI